MVNRKRRKDYTSMVKDSLTSRRDHTKVVISVNV